ncbi:hypothetical protein DUNSADRAFT_7000 [Dunaliella salina]|uniref:Uncharacterized protein n=1 Tax=Dunaliella salina TaxID=3046 RepID=A0ABQ7FTR4_DUNSA|nr:hypothetical protein DUNSADRAFT_7000 [Dunaliella salina]|eukprot:KAF5825782.1 hypothetical protein DUNSADRAFT_7000 [Dunaliella salina]
MRQLNLLWSDPNLWKSCSVEILARLPECIQRSKQHKDMQKCSALQFATGIQRRTGNQLLDPIAICFLGLDPGVRAVL